MIGFLKAPAFAQETDLSGEWLDDSYEEDDRGGPRGATSGGGQNNPISDATLGNYLGVPLNDAGRLKAASFDASIYSHPAVMMRPHPVQYSMRGFIRSWRMEKIIDLPTQALIAYRVIGGYTPFPRMIWLDGRPHPPDYAEHSTTGFSTGRWERGMLVVTTTHMRTGFHKRNGVPASPEGKMTEYFIRHGDRLIHVQFIEDPAYLSEPFIRTTDHIRVLDRHAQNVHEQWDIAEEQTGWEKDYVPHYPMGTRHTEFADLLGIPYEVTQGGAEQMYPEYRLKLKQMMSE
jgi:hypothetical protein